MGWRERDWARFNKAERDAIYGAHTSGSGAGRGHAGGASVSWRTLGVGLALAASLTVFLLGQLPRGNPVLDAVNFPLRLPSTDPPRVPPAKFSLHAPPRLHQWTLLTFRGTTGSDVDGKVVLQGRTGQTPWRKLAAGSAAHGSYRLIWNTKATRGTLHLRLRLPDGSIGLGTTHVL